MRTLSPPLYLLSRQEHEHRVLEKAAEILEERYVRGDVFTNPQATRDYLRFKIGGSEREVFAVMLLDNQHRLIEFKVLFQGTIDAASVYPREVVKTALKANAAAVIFAHNHPSGDPEPSQADRRITTRLQDALALIDVRVLDHIVVGGAMHIICRKGLVMIEKHYGDITINSKLHQQLEQTIARYSIPKDTTRIALNCRNTSYYKTKEGVAPVEVQLKRENSRSDWNLVFVANFTYQDKATDSLDVYLYFHLLNHWCYQPDAGAASLSHPVTTKVFQAWMCAFHEHLTQHVFDDIQLTQVR